MSNAKIISLLHHELRTQREAQTNDLEVAFAYLHSEMAALAEKYSELRYEVDQLMQGKGISPPN